MNFSSELYFFNKILNKCHIHNQMIDPNLPLNISMNDFGFKTFIKEEEFNKNLYDFITPLKGNTIYKIKDSFSCYHLMMLLPNNNNKCVLYIGPYLSNEISKENILEKIEKYSFNPQQTKEIEQIYGNIPIVSDNDSIYTVIYTLAEYIWGENQYNLVDLNKEYAGSDSPLKPKHEQSDAEKTMLNMQIMESRYAYENEIMKAVSNGQIHKAELMISRFSKMAVETRLADPVRNIKNYCIIMNTLLRKAAEHGGVHPMYLDSTSSNFAQKIEGLNSVSSVQELMLEMFRSYCRLVNKHSMKNYSVPVQKAIIYIDSDLTADLSLSAISSVLNISPGYLSALFKKETGQTLTEHVNRKRIKNAMLLLETTKLQIQTIAQYCGILDMQYFSKIFKKYTGTSPKKYRESK